MLTEIESHVLLPGYIQRKKVYCIDSWRKKGFVWMDAGAEDKN